jgi:hypothetical protein
MIEAVGGNPESRWLEPSFGHGVFIEELHSRGIPAAQITGIDLETAAMPNDRFGSVIRGQDFLTWSLRTQFRFDRIVANPPYVSLSDLPTEARIAAMQFTLPTSRDTLPGRSNLWAAFLLGALKVLNFGGAIAFVLPASWDYADYCEHLRDELPSLFEEWYCLRCEEPLFPGVDEGSVVLVGRGFGGIHRANERMDCLRGDDLVARLKLLGKSPSKSSSKLKVQLGETLKLSEIVDIRLGGVTGDARYFLLTEQQRNELGLPKSAVKPVLSKAAHLQTALIDETAWGRLRENGARIWLFRPSKRVLQHPKVAHYLQLQFDKGGCNRSAAKIRDRTPWYRVPLPWGVDGFISGMGGSGPWLALNQMPTLSASNTLYTVRFQKRTPLPDRASLGLALLLRPVRAQMDELCRRYALGLGKFEPGDLQNLRIPKYAVPIRALADYQDAVNALLSGSYSEAATIAHQSLGHK